MANDIDEVVQAKHTRQSLLIQAPRNLKISQKPKNNNVQTSVGRKMSFHQKNPSLELHLQIKRNSTVIFGMKGLKTTIDDPHDLILQSSHSSAGGGMPKTVVTTNYLTQSGRDPLAVES